MLDEIRGYRQQWQNLYQQWIDALHEYGYGDSRVLKITSELFAVEQLDRNATDKVLDYHRRALHRIDGLRMAAINDCKTNNYWYSDDFLKRRLKLLDKWYNEHLAAITELSML